MVESALRSCLTIILAAGEGKRMASDLPKVLHPVAGLPMVCHVVDTAREAGSDDLAVVVGNKAELVQDRMRWDTLDPCRIMNSCATINMRRKLSS